MAFRRAGSRRDRLPRRAGASADWVAANPGRIAAKAARAMDRPTGGWVVAGATPKAGSAPRQVMVVGRPLVLWPGPGGPLVGPDVCPHMGAELSCGAVMDDGSLVCPWHDLRLGPDGHSWWKPLPVHDDGVLTWVRLESDEPLDAPLLPKRPDAALAGVVERAGRCEPRDIVENRLDPWHGRYLHPYAFADLVVVDEDDSGITCDVDYRIAGPVIVRVTARFEAPEAATVTMGILDGVGAGSKVETHAVSEGPGRTRVVEAFFAASDKLDLSQQWWAPGMGRFLGRAFDRLWRDDIVYAERRYALREGKVQGWRG
jgi:hypothetical protein